MSTMTGFAPLVNETADQFVARLAQAWADITPAEPEPADEPSEADQAWNAANSPLNELECPDSPVWDERWTVTGAEEWTADRDDPADDPDYLYEWEEAPDAPGPLGWDAEAVQDEALEWECQEACRIDRVSSGMPLW